MQATELARAAGACLCQAANCSSNASSTVLKGVRRAVLIWTMCSRTRAKSERHMKMGISSVSITPTRKFTFSIALSAGAHWSAVGQFSMTVLCSRPSVETFGNGGARKQT